MGCRQCLAVPCCAVGIAAAHRLKMWRPGIVVGGCPLELWRLEEGEGYGVPCMWSSVEGAEQVGGCQ